MNDQDKQAKIKGLYNYLKQNPNYLLNYQQRQQTAQPYTSQVAESHIDEVNAAPGGSLRENVDSLINTRHKRTGKMQWTREAAHQVLQIRATMACNHWEHQWQNTVLPALGALA